MIKLLSGDEKKAQILEAIDKLLSGEIVDVDNASGSAYSLCIGDFRMVQMSTKNTWKTGMNWTWNGPGTIRMNGIIYKPGHETEEIDMDWS